MLLGLETSDSQMNRVAKNEIFFECDITPKEVAASIDAVTNAEIVELARALTKREHLSLTLLGDLKGRQIRDGILAAA
jgi:predicted Zn-dependent peptidase